METVRAVFLAFIMTLASQRHLKITEIPKIY